MQNARFPIQSTGVALFNLSIAQVGAHSVDCVAQQVAQADVKRDAVQLILFKVRIQLHFEVCARKLRVLAERTKAGITNTIRGFLLAIDVVRNVDFFRLHSLCIEIQKRLRGREPVLCVLFQLTLAFQFAQVGIFKTAVGHIIIFLSANVQDQKGGRNGNKIFGKDCLHDSVGFNSFGYFIVAISRS